MTTVLPATGTMALSAPQRSKTIGALFGRRGTSGGPALTRRLSLKPQRTVRISPQSLLPSAKAAPATLRRGKTLDSMLARVFKGKTPARPKGQLSAKATLEKDKREAAMAALGASQALQAARNGHDECAARHGALVSELATAQEARAATLRHAAAAHIGDNEFSEVHDLRLMNVPPARTALVASCACSLLSASIPALASDASSTDVAAPSSPEIAVASPRARRAGKSSGGGGGGGGSNALLVSWEECLSRLSRTELRAGIAQSQLLALLANRHLVASVALQADWASAVADAASARTLGGTVGGGADGGRRKGRPAGVMLEKLQSATAQRFGARSAAASGRAGGGGRGGGLAAVAATAVSSERTQLESAVRAEIKAQMTHEQAASSTSAAGHLFLWVAHTLAAVHALHQHAIDAQPAIATAAATLTEAARVVAECAAADEAARARASATADALTRYLHEEAVREAKERLAAADASAAAAAATGRGGAYGGGTGGAGGGSAVACGAGQGGASEPHSGCDGAAEASAAEESLASLPLAERRAAELARFKKMREGEEEQMKKRALEGGGALLD